MGTKALLTAMQGDDKKNFKNFKMGKEETRTINGMQSTFYTATGDFEGEVTYVERGYIEAEKTVLIDIIIFKGEAGAIGPDMDKVLMSIKKK